MSENFWDMHMENDENAARYMETYGEGAGSDTRKVIASFIKDGESVLDVGCGPGWNLDHFQQFGPKIRGYRGLDYSERFVRVANKRHNKDHNQRFRVGDCRELKEPKRSWDVVILQDVLEYVPGYEKPVLEALRVARKRVIITFWHLTENDDHINDDGNDGWGAWYSKPKWEEFLNSLNIKWTHIKSEPDANRQHDFYVLEAK